MLKWDHGILENSNFNDLGLYLYVAVHNLCFILLMCNMLLLCTGVQRLLHHLKKEEKRKIELDPWTRPEPARLKRIG